MKHLNEFEEINESKNLDNNYEYALSLADKLKILNKEIKTILREKLSEMQSISDEYNQIESNMVSDELDRLNDILKSSELGKPGRINKKNNSIGFTLINKIRTYDTAFLKKSFEDGLGETGSIIVSPLNPNAHMETNRIEVKLTKGYIKKLSNLPNITPITKFLRTIEI